MDRLPSFERRLARTDLASIVVPAAPVAWGDRIVYVVHRTDVVAEKAYSSLWSVPRSGGGPRRLTQGDHRDRLVRADPRGRFVVFVSDRDGGDQLLRLDADGGDS